MNLPGKNDVQLFHSYGKEALTFLGDTGIGEMAFAGSTIEKLYLPNTVTDVADNFVEGCAKQQDSHQHRLKYIHNIENRWVLWQGGAIHRDRHDKRQNPFQ